MERLARVVAVVAAVAGGGLAGWVLGSPLGTDPAVGGHLPAVFEAEGAAVACGAVVAVGVTAVLARRRSLLPAVVGTVLGLLLLALPALVRYPAQTWVLMYSNSVAAGLVLGSAALWAARRTGAQAGLVGGMTAALLAAGGVGPEGLWSSPQGWAGYAPLTTSPSSSAPSAVAGAWLPIAAAVLVVLAALLDRRPPASNRIDSRVLFTAAALPILAFAADRILADAGASARMSILYVVAVVAVVSWLAWQLPGNDGRILFAATAVVAAATGSGYQEGAQWWVLLVPVALVAAGTVAGLRFPYPTLGFGLLALVAAAVLVTEEPWNVLPAAGFTFLLPLAAGFVVGACLPTTAPASTVGTSLLFTVGVPGVAATVWIAGTRYADHATSSLMIAAPSAPAGAVAVAVGVVVVCGVGAWGLDLRSGAR